MKTSFIEVKSLLNLEAPDKDPVPFYVLVESLVASRRIVAGAALARELL